jgi:PLP dependent protein
VITLPDPHAHAMPNIAERITRLKGEIPAGVKLVVVSKYQSPETILEAYQAGHRCFGENRAQELSAKAPLLPDDIEWHFIGHLQTNKVKAIIPFVSIIHSVDSCKLLLEIVKAARNANRKVSCLLQFHIAREESKYGFSFEEAEAMLREIRQPELDPVSIIGVMGMATFTEDTDQIASEFKTLSGIFRELRENYFPDQPCFREVSMGMSDDFRIAIREGSTLLRIGSAVFQSIT